MILVAHDAATKALADTTVHLGPSGQTGAERETVGAAVRATHILNQPNAPAAPVRQTTANDHANAPFDAVATGRFGAAKALAAVLKPIGWKFTAAAAVGVLAALFAVALSGLSGWLIIRASQQPPILYLLGAIVGVRFFGIGRAVLRYCERLLTHDAIFAAMTTLRGSLWATLSRRALALRRLLQGGNVLGAIVDDVDTLRDLLPRVVLPPLTAIGVGAAAVIATTIVLPAALPATILALLCGLLAAPALSLVADRNAAKAEQKLRAQVLTGVAAALDARADLTANRVAGPLLKVLRDKDRYATTAAQRSAWAEGMGQAVTVLGCSLAALWTGTLAAGTGSGPVAPPELVAVIVLMQLALVEPYAGVVTAIRQAPALAAVLQRVNAAGALESEPEALDEPRTAAGEVANDGGRPGTPAKLPHAGLRLEGIAASWPDGPTVFSNISAEARPGRWLAVTGPSGSGKSTLLSVLLGFLPVTEGTVRLSGTVAWCPQEAHLFDSTIRGNLMLGRPAANKPSEADMYKALADVGLDALVQTLPAKLDTRIGPGGVFLSGGERQRLAMARTLLTGAKILLLDEPTAHLDAGAAETMMAALRRGLKDVTVVLVTHHQSDIDPSDARLDLPDRRIGTESAAELVGRPTRQ